MRQFFISSNYKNPFKQRVYDRQTEDTAITPRPTQTQSGITCQDPN